MSKKFVKVNGIRVNSQGVNVNGDVKEAFYINISAISIIRGFDVFGKKNGMVRVDNEYYINVTIDPIDLEKLKEVFF